MKKTGFAVMAAVMAFVAFSLFGCTTNTVNGGDFYSVNENDNPINITLNVKESPSGEIPPGNRVLAVFDVQPPKGGAEIYGLRIRQTNDSPYIADPTGFIWVEDASGANILTSCNYVGSGDEYAFYSIECWGEYNVPTDTKFYVMGHVNATMAQLPDQDWDPPPLFHVELLDVYASEDVILDKVQGNELAGRFTANINYILSLTPDSPQGTISAGQNVELMKLQIGTNISAADLYALIFDYNSDFDGSISNCQLVDMWGETINNESVSDTYGDWVYLYLQNVQWSYPLTQLTPALQTVSLKCDVTTNNPNQELKLGMSGIAAWPVDEQYSLWLDPTTWPKVVLTIN